MNYNLNLCHHKLVNSLNIMKKLSFPNNGTCLRPGLGPTQPRTWPGPPTYWIGRHRLKSRPQIGSALGDV